MKNNIEIIALEKQKFWEHGPEVGSSIPMYIWWQPRYNLPIKPFLANIHILSPLKTPETAVFLVFSGGIKWNVLRNGLNGQKWFKFDKNIYKKHVIKKIKFLSRK